jgi:Uma2 family endonuclease
MSSSEHRPIVARKVVLTYEDYAALPNDGRRYELHEGELSIALTPGTSHQRILGNLCALLHQHVEQRALGEVFFAPLDCILSPTTIVQPDLVFIDNSRAGLVSERGVEGPPTLAVEVLSPSTTKTDRGVKLQLYAKYGVPYYWIVDPGARTLEAFELAGESYALSARVWGNEPANLPPFTELALVPEALWPVPAS